MKAQLLKTLRKLFALGGNQDTDRFELRDEFFDFLTKEEQVFMPSDDQNIIIAKDAVRFSDA